MGYCIPTFTVDFYGINVGKYTTVVTLMTRTKIVYRIQIMGANLQYLFMISGKHNVPDF